MDEPSIKNSLKYWATCIVVRINTVLEELPKSANVVDKRNRAITETEETLVEMHKWFEDSVL